ncbi:hypothetical protein BOX15_Mlig031269g1 [Macrostomum lignano]|uniref:RRM domain-containing protein n=2 Tax=Macrostomum lignano TaxID=282301 RepID=A0A267DYD7_9PLAT|nr:hypothetical protein BOX15_Mlig031269g1 [Macrostomum lignano]
MKRPSVPYSNGVASAMPAANAGHWTSVGQWPNAKRPCQSVPTAVDAYRQNLLSTDYDHHNHLRHSNQRDQHSNQPSYHANSLHGNQLDSHLGNQFGYHRTSQQQQPIDQHSNKRVTIATSEPELSPILASDLHQSPVVHVSNLAPNTTEAALLHSLSSFGVIRDIVVLPSRATAYVQFNDILAAQTAVAASRGNQRPPTVHGQRLRLQYCRQPGIDHAGALDGGRRSRVLLLVLTDLAAGGPPVTAQLLRQAASQFGRITRLLVMRRDHVADMCVHALVEYSSQEEATRAKRHLNGAQLFQESHRIRASYSNQTEIRFSPGVTNDACHYSAELLEAPDAPYRACLLDWSAGLVPAFARCDRAVQTAAADLYSALAPNSVEPSASSFQLHQASAHQTPQLQQQSEEPQPSTGSCTHRCLLLRNVPRNLVNCQRLFNLLCLYGNVLRLKFLRNRPDTVIAEFGQPADCSAALRHLSGCPLFGRRLTALPCRQDSVIKHRSVDTLPDGSPAYADYTGSKNNRFVVAGKARRNRLCSPSATLHFFNLPNGVTDANLSDLFGQCGAERPVRLVRFGNSGGGGAKFVAGLAEFSSRDAAVRAVCLANHLPVPTAAAEEESATVTGKDAEQKLQQRQQQHLLKLNFSDSAILSGTAGGAAA